MDLTPKETEALDSILERLRKEKQGLTEKDIEEYLKYCLDEQDFEFEVSMIGQHGIRYIIQMRATFGFVHWRAQNTIKELAKDVLPRN